MNPATVSTVPKPNMVMRSIRVPLVLWQAAKEKADAEDKNISDVLRELLTEYVQRDD